MPARVVAEPSDGNYIVKQGRRVQLKCAATGNPKPQIEWSRKVKTAACVLLRNSKNAING